MATTKIGKNSFSVQPLGFLRSLYLQPKLAPVIAEVGRAIYMLVKGELADKLKAGKVTIEDLMGLDLAELPLDDLVVSVTRIAGHLQPKELEYITRELLYDATMDGLPLFAPGQDAIDGLMVGRMFDGWRLLFFAVKVNYPDVFSLSAATAASGAKHESSAASITSDTSPAPTG